MAYSEAMRESGRAKLAARVAEVRPQFQSDAVDNEYMDFALAAEHLLLSRTPHTRPREVHRGWPTVTKLGPLRPQKTGRVDGQAYKAFNVGGTRSQTR